MAGVKYVDKKTYKWSHIGVIIYHTLTAMILLICQYYPRMLLFRPKTIVVALAAVLLITSLLAIVPIAKDYDKLIIE